MMQGRRSFIQRALASALAGFGALFVARASAGAQASVGVDRGLVGVHRTDMRLRSCNLRTMLASPRELGYRKLAKCHVFLNGHDMTHARVYAASERYGFIMCYESPLRTQDGDIARELAPRRGRVEILFPHEYDAQAHANTRAHPHAPARAGVE